MEDNTVLAYQTSSENVEDNTVLAYQDSSENIEENEEDSEAQDTNRYLN